MVQTGDTRLSRNQAVKHGLFERGIKAAKAAVGVEDLYLCPICAKGFHVDSLLSGLLTLEHVPPKSQGGKAIILTCRNCNNMGGYTVDAAVSHRRRVKEFADSVLIKTTGNSDRGFLTVDGVRLNIAVLREINETKIEFIRQHNNPRALERAKASFENYTKPLGYIEEGEGELTFNIRSAASYSQQLARVGDLKSAFLVCCAALGYSFAFSATLRHIRSQILSPKEKFLESWHVSVAGIPRRPCIVFAQEFNLLLVTYSERTIYLPWPSGDQNAVHEFERTAREEPNLGMTGIIIPWPKTFVAALDHKL
jgi:hypothetical protein